MASRRGYILGVSAPLLMGLVGSAAMARKKWPEMFGDLPAKLTVPAKKGIMESSVDIPPEQFQGMGDCERDGAASQSREQDYVQNLIKSNRVVVFSKSHCPHCDDSKMLLNNMGVPYTAVELDKMKEGTQVQSILGRLTNAKTVPRIFIDGQCVGGNSDLMTLNKSGELRGLLQRVGNIKEPDIAE